MIKLSAYIIALNEEDRIEKTILAIKQVADEVIVVDSGSIDKTVAIAKKLGAVTVFNKWESYCKQKYFAEQYCSNDWVLLVDADEVLNEKLIKDIQKIKENPEFNAYNIKVKNVLPNKEKPYLPWSDFNIVRLYNRKVCSMPADKGNHDRVFVPKTERVGQLKGYMKHYTFLSIEQAVTKYNLHSSEMQKALTEKGKEYSLLRLFTEYPRQFLIYYFKKGLIFGGVQGFIYANVGAYFRFLKVAKNFEARNKISKKSKA